MSSFSFKALQQVAKESGFTVLDAATYRMKVTKASAEKSKNGGKDMLKTTLSVSAGPMAGKGSVINYFVISPESPAALHFFFMHMEAFGLDEAYFGQPGLTMEQAAKDLLNREAMVELTIGQYQGNDKNEVGKITRVTDGPSTAPAVNAGPGVPVVSSPTAASNGTPTVTQPATDERATPGEKPELVGAGAGTGGVTMPKAPF